MHNYPINQTIDPDNEDFHAIHEIMAENQPLIAQLSMGYQPPEAVRNLLSQITQSQIDDSVHINLPFYSDFGRHIRLGKNVFINTGAMFTDLGGIIIEDNVLIAPRVNILTVNHPLDPQARRGIILQPVHIKKNAWIGAGASILPNVTIGENAIVAAGAVVTKDVPDNVIVAGNPAKIIKSIPQA